MSTTLDQAIAAIEAGNKAEGQRLLAEIIKSDPNNEYAWLWMSRAVEYDQNRQQCLEHILKINPNNQIARKELEQLGVEVSAPPTIVQAPSQSIWTESTKGIFAVIFIGASLCFGPSIFLCALTATGLNPASIGIGVIASVIGIIIPLMLFWVMVSSNSYEAASTMRTVFRLLRLLR